MHHSQQEAAIHRLLKVSLVFGWIGGLICGGLLLAIDASVQLITIVLIGFGGLQLNLILVNRLFDWLRARGPGIEH